MHSARRIAAFLFVALWLPALLHCRLEAAGVLFNSECCDSSHRPAAKAAAACVDDACDVAEGEFTKPASTAAPAPAPVLCTCLICLEIAPPELALTPPLLTGVAEASAAPPEVQRSWVFVARAALSPRAPSLIA